MRMPQGDPEEERRIIQEVAEEIVAAEQAERGITPGELYEVLQAGVDRLNKFYEGAPSTVTVLRWALEAMTAKAHEIDERRHAS